MNKKKKQKKLSKNTFPTIKNLTLMKLKKTKIKPKANSEDY